MVRLKFIFAFLAICCFAHANPPSNMPNNNSQQNMNSMNQQNGQHRRPPKEALDACNNISEGGSCNFTAREGRSIAGTCFRPDSSKPLACKPGQMH